MLYRKVSFTAIKHSDLSLALMQKLETLRFSSQTKLHSLYSMTVVFTSSSRPHAKKKARNIVLRMITFGLCLKTYVMMAFYLPGMSDQRHSRFIASARHA